MVHNPGRIRQERCSRAVAPVIVRLGALTFRRAMTDRGVGIPGYRFGLSGGLGGTVVVFF